MVDGKENSEITTLIYFYILSEKGKEFRIIRKSLLAGNAKNLKYREYRVK